MTAEALPVRPVGALPVPTPGLVASILLPALAAGAATAALALPRSDPWVPPPPPTETVVPAPSANVRLVPVAAWLAASAAAPFARPEELLAAEASPLVELQGADQARAAGASRLLDVHTLRLAETAAPRLRTVGARARPQPLLPVSPPELESLSGGVRPAPPARVSIPAVGADGPVDAVPARAGELVVPPPGRAGWFEGGARPGEPGRAVIVSHVSSRRGPALFAGLLRLPPGSAIAVEDRRGRTHLFRVARRVRVEKTSFPAGSVYGSARGAELVLVTCGGPFTPGKGFRDNVILYARKAV